MIAASNSSSISQWLENPVAMQWLVFGGILFLGLPVAWLLGAIVRKLSSRKFTPAFALTFGRVVRWSLMVAVLAAAPLVSGLGMHSEWLRNVILLKVLGATLILVIGMPLAAIVGRLVRGIASAKFSPELGLILSRVVRWLLFGVVIATVLSQFGVNLGAALGAAGIVGIAVGFAAQTSLSNVISGFFLLGEKPFRIGDLIEVDGVIGIVDKIGMISASIRTMDNKSVRIPNETLVKSKVSNITGNPIRRYDLEIGVAYDEDIDHVMRVLREVAENNKHCLDEPDPLVLFVGFGDSSINFLLGCWTTREDYLLVRNSIAAQLQKAFKSEGIEIPFPHRVLAGGKAGGPLEVRISQASAND